MARIRPAVPCAARRSNGEPCKNYAMLGGAVCHAHGGKAPQTRQAAQRRLIMAQAERAFARLQAVRQAREDALSPWAPEIRLERLMGQITPKESARRLRRIATEMTKVARDLRAEAKRLDEQAALADSGN
jgi:hypothetical protein